MNAEQNAELIDTAKEEIHFLESVRERRGNLFDLEEHKLALMRIALASLTAPPVPVTKAVKLPDGFAPSTDSGSGGMKPSVGGYWLSKVDVVKALREAGIQIEGEE